MGRCDVCFETRNVEVTTGTTNYSTPLQYRHFSLFLGLLVRRRQSRYGRGCGFGLDADSQQIDTKSTWMWK